MVTKSLTQGPVRARSDLNRDTGKPDVIDEHPLIACAPHVLSGHAHLKGRRIPVERVLAALMNERPRGPLLLSATGTEIKDEEVRAVMAYAIDVFGHLSQLYAELGRLRSIEPK